MHKASRNKKTYSEPKTTDEPYSNTKKALSYYMHQYRNYQVKQHGMMRKQLNITEDTNNPASLICR